MKKALDTKTIFNLKTYAKIDELRKSLRAEKIYVDFK